MKLSTKPLALAAALAGLAGGTAAHAAQPSQGGFGAAAGMVAEAAADKKKNVEKHACKGMNSCKGQGGGDKKQWGKNECKGKGACATDGSKPKM